MINGLSTRRYGVHRARFVILDVEWTARRGQAVSGRAWHDTLIFESPGETTRCIHEPDPNWHHWSQERLRELWERAKPCSPP